jgi:hypothetical protein
MAAAVASDPIAAKAALEWAAAASRETAASPSGWVALHPFSAVPGHNGDGNSVNAKAPVAILPDDSVRIPFVKDPNVYRSGDFVKATLSGTEGPVAKIRLEALTDPTFGGRVTNENSGGFFARTEAFSVQLELAVLRAGSETPEPLAIADAYPNQTTNSYENGHVMTSVTAEWRSDPALVMKNQSADYILAQPIVLKPGDRLVATIKSEDIGRVRLSASPFGVALPGVASDAGAIESLRASASAQAAPPALCALFFRSTGAGHAREFSKLLSSVRGIAECRDGRAFTLVTVATRPLVTRVLHRGDWQDETGEVVQPLPPAFLPGSRPKDGAPRQTRLDLANWITSRENPLTARAFMNRLWKQYFGTGISAVVDDLGLQGEYPSHPELLDWLAVEFMDRGWDVKAMVREIVTSSTYRQSSRYRPELADIDPNNRLLARQTPRRLEAEFVRDNALAAAGLINLDIGGPSVHPYQPDGYYAALQFPDRDYVAENDERQYRRGVYMHWQRTFLHPMLANFDAPSREECTAARIVSSTPQQALTLLNDPTFVEAARGLAEQAVSQSPQAPFAETLGIAFERLLARPPDPREADSLHAFFTEQLAYYSGKPEEARKLISVGNHPAPSAEDPAKLAAWTAVARVMINLNEAIVRY